MKFSTSTLSVSLFGIASVSAESIRKAHSSAENSERNLGPWVQSSGKKDDMKEPSAPSPVAPSPSGPSMHAGSTTFVCTVAGDDTPAMPGTKSRYCTDKGIELTEENAGLLSMIPGSSEFLKYYKLYEAEGYTVGSITDLVVEAGDAAVSGATVEDGKSGDVAFPFGEIKPIVTAGERSVCDESLGEVIVGKPDGMGAYLLDDHTIRVLFQSESYGPLTANEAWAYPVNNGAALIGGSHINYVDYDREMFSKFMTYSGPASDMVVGMGQHIKRAYNLRNELLSHRVRDGATPVGAHLSNTNAEGEWAVARLPRIEYDWFYQSLCSAHMEEAHQWGPGIGFEDDVYLTNEEWHSYNDEMTFVGNTYHALDVTTDTMYAIGAMSMGGFEKSAEINAQHPEYVMIAMSGYNGAYGRVGSGMGATLEARKAFYGETRPDGKEWILPENVHPYRFYLGVKGLMEDGSPAKEDDFLARNGLRYGQVYGFAIDMTETGPTGGKWRDDAHVDAPNGFKVPGYFAAQPWRWNGTVVDFQHDGSWDFQLDIPGEGWEGYKWWNAAGYDEAGEKTEHLTSDTRNGVTAFIQSSTAGYFGHVYINNVHNILDGLKHGELPPYFPAEYYVYQGHSDIRGQVELGGKGQYTDGPDGETRDATCNWDNVNNGCKETFEDIDGMEYICGSDCCRVILQEDSGNDLGERCLISSCLEHDYDEKELTYYLVAVSGGSENTRMKAGVGIPKTSNAAAGSHEFSGVFDLSGLIRKEDGHFTLSASDEGFYKRAEEKKVSTNDKYIMINVQASNMNDRIIVEFGADTGGQVMIYKPRLPGH